jgi:hypothetical protein
MLLYLHDPDILHQREVDSVFKMPTKNQIEILAKKLMSRLFPNDVTPEEEPEEVPVIDDENMTMEEEMCYFYVAEKWVMVFTHAWCPNCKS